MSRYSNNKITKKTLLPNKKNNVSVYETTIYKRIPETNSDLHLIAVDGDRLDNLAFQFYGDPSLWWYIAKANHLNSINVEAGTSLRIPISTELAVGL